MATSETRPPARTWVARAFSAVEDLVYIGLGVILASCAIVLLGYAFVSFGRSLLTGALPSIITTLLDRILLILLIVELLYTVQVSLREHSVVPEPFLLVGLIAAIRRVLLLTAEFGEFGNKGGSVIVNFLWELAVLTVLIVALAASLSLLRTRAAEHR
jgi:uncharacterized membrane protein (DUF373 family)